MPLKLTRLTFTCILAAFISLCHAQSVIVQSNIILPKDSVIKNQLISSLNGFLSQKEKPNRDNAFVWKENLLETSALLDEMKGIDRNLKTKEDNFYKCYLTNVVEFDDNDFIVQFSYMAMPENAPVLHASFKLSAKRENGRFYFYSPLKQNTVSWKTKKVGTITWHYKDTMNKANIKLFEASILSYDKRLNCPVESFDSYYCDNLSEVLQIVGIEYEANLNGLKNQSLSSHEANRDLFVNGGSYYGSFFDPHDLWHDRLRTVMKSAVINRPVDEGCAYLYGGSWGYTWEEVLQKFKKYVAANPNANWLNLYIETTNMEGGDKPIKVGYVLNALIARKLEKEKGFSAVRELLGCGPREKGDDNYFKTLDKLTGINKGNFNEQMQKLTKDL
jgi:hypothetical protein